MSEYNDDPELLLENVANLDTARMTLRWALERIRGLEKSNSETHELLSAAHAARQKSVDALESFKLSMADRAARVAEKERFVSEMQTILNDLFRGEVDVAEFIRRRTDIESAKADLEKKVRKRLQEAEDAHRKELEENNKRLAEMEGVYSSALTDAQRKYRDQLQSLQSEQDAQIREERKKLDEVRERSHRDGVKQADEYQRKILSLEHNFHAKRAELDADIERLREKLLEEQTRHINRAQEESAALQKNWDCERGRLEALLSEREKQVAEQEESLVALERDYHQRHREQARRFEEDLASLQTEHLRQTEAHAQALAEAGEKIREQAEAFQAERLLLLERQNRLREDVAAEYEQTFAALQKSLIEKESSRAAAVGSRIEEMQRAHDATLSALQARLEGVREKAARREEELGERHEADLEALRRHFDGQREQDKLDYLKRTQAHAEETRALRLKLREEADAQLLEQSRQAAAHAERMRTLEDALDESRSKGLRATEERHAQTLAEFADLHQRQRRDCLQEEQELRKEDNLRMRESLRRQIEAAHAREEAHARETAELESRGAQEREAMRAEFDRERARLESSLKAAEIRREAELRELRERHRLAADALHADAGAARAQNEAVREEELLKRERAVSELEKFFKEAQRKNWAETDERLEAMRRQYQRALQSLREEKEGKRRPEKIEAGAFPPGAAAAAPPALPVRSMPERAQPKAASAQKLINGKSQTRPRRHWLKFTILSAAAAAGLWTLQQWQDNGARNHTVPFSHPAALVWEGQSLWAADWKEQTVYRMRWEGKRLVEDARFSIPESHVAGMALAEGRVYISDSWKHTLQRWRLDRGRLLLEKTWPSPGPNPAALYFDGMHLWSADLTERRLYRHLVDDALTILDSFPVDHAAIGLFADKERFWSADADNRIVFRHRWDRSLTPIRSLSLEELEDGKSPLAAFTMRKNSVWLGREGSDELLERPLSNFSQDAL